MTDMAPPLRLRLDVSAATPTGAAQFLRQVAHRLESNIESVSATGGVRLVDEFKTATGTMRIGGLTMHTSKILHGPPGSIDPAFAAQYAGQIGRTAVNPWDGQEATYKSHGALHVIDDVPAWARDKLPAAAIVHIDEAKHFMRHLIPPTQ